MGSNAKAEACLAVPTPDSRQERPGRKAKETPRRLD